MILNRIGNAIKRQDWFVVILEVLIVVFGVFIGLQVDDWNTERTERAELRVLLEQLALENERSIATYQSYIEESVGYRTTLEEYFRYLVSPETNSRPIDADLFLFLCRSGVNSGWEVDTPVMEELLDKGYLSYLGDADIQETIQAFRSRKQNSVVVTERLAPVIHLAVQALYPYQNLGLHEANASLGSCSFDYEGFEARPDAATLIARIQRNDVVHENTARLMLERLVEVQEAVLRELGREGDAQ